jgi:hypothetical protein
MTREEVYERLKTEVQSVEWEAIEPHQKREAVFLCAPEQDILDVGASIALDEIDHVKELMSQNKLYKITDEIAGDYSKSKKFLFIIIQPFVIVQEMH